MDTKQERAEVINQLIKIIGSHGRRFFYSESKDAFASMEVDENGKVWFVDDYTGAKIYTHYKGHWRKFSHGGTMRDLVLRFARYIAKGESLPRWVIGPETSFSDGNIWGYTRAEITAVREKAFSLPCFGVPA